MSWWWLWLACTPVCPPGDVVSVAGRSVRLQVPSGGPLLVGLHGYGMTAPTYAETTGLTCVPEGMGTALPNGVNWAWDITDPRPDGLPQMGDDKVFAALVEEYGAGGSAVVGLSNGALRVLRDYCDPDSPFDAYASVLGSFEEGTAADCDPAEPRPVVLVNGTEDPLVPYEGGDLLGWELLPVPETAERIRALNGCAPTPLVRWDGSQQWTTWTGCAAETTLLTVHGMGHQWPGAEPLPLLGPSIDELDLTSWLHAWVATATQGER